MVKEAQLGAALCPALAGNVSQVSLFNDSNPATWFHVYGLTAAVDVACDIVVTRRVGTAGMTQAAACKPVLFQAPAAPGSVWILNLAAAPTTFAQVLGCRGRLAAELFKDYPFHVLPPGTVLSLSTDVQNVNLKASFYFLSLPDSG